MAWLDDDNGDGDDNNNEVNSFSRKWRAVDVNAVQKVNLIYFAWLLS